jgi:hypothetical protein
MERAYDSAFALLSMACPCEAIRIVTDGLYATPADQAEVADAWIRLGDCVSKIIGSVTPH